MENKLILVFYLDRILFTKTPEILNQVSTSIETFIEKKELNAIAIFLPTDNTERVECINPVIVTEEKINEINKIISDMKKQFSITDEKLNNEINE
jgi:hypothetical protein